MRFCKSTDHLYGICSEDQVVFIKSDFQRIACLAKNATEHLGRTPWEQDAHHAIGMYVSPRIARNAARVCCHEAKMLLLGLQ